MRSERAWMLGGGGGAGARQWPSALPGGGGGAVAAASQNSPSARRATLSRANMRARVALERVDRAARPRLTKRALSVCGVRRREGVGVHALTRWPGSGSSRRWTTPSAG